MPLSRQFVISFRMLDTPTPLRASWRASGIVSIQSSTMTFGLLVPISGTYSCHQTTNNSGSQNVYAYAATCVLDTNAAKTRL